MQYRQSCDKYNNRRAYESGTITGNGDLGAIDGNEVTADAFAGETVRLIHAEFASLCGREATALEGICLVLACKKLNIYLYQ